MDGIGRPENWMREGSPHTPSANQTDLRCPMDHISTSAMLSIETVSISLEVHSPILHEHSGWRHCPSLFASRRTSWFLPFVFKRLLIIRMYHDSGCSFKKCVCTRLCMDVHELIGRTLTELPQEVASHVQSRRRRAYWRPLRTSPKKSSMQDG